MAGAGKAEAVRALGAHEVIGRDGVEALGADRFDVVVDLVAGPGWPELLDVLRPRGRLVAAGAIAGPLVDLDVRMLYLKDLTLAGATRQAPEVFPALVGYVERDEIRPVVHAAYPLADIARAQIDFGAKGFVGKLVLVPPS
jgi:NADPH:quinone reductase-like Zn-dependent oxidoreductase